jgi:uncharacterized protein (DUF736 family)
MLTLFLRVGGQLTTDAPSMGVVTSAEHAAVKDLHASAEFFHSDHAHTDYVARSNGGASWVSPPLATECELQKSRIKASLWIGTNAKATDFTVQLSHWTKGGDWSSLCETTVNTLSRKVDDPTLPGKGMIAVMGAARQSGEAHLVALMLTRFCFCVPLPPTRVRSQRWFQRRAAPRNGIARRCSGSRGRSP